MQNKEILFEVVPDGNIHMNIQALKKLGNVAGLLVDLRIKEGATFLCIRYSEEFSEFIRNRNAGRPRKKEEVQLTCGEVFSLKEEEGAKVAAARLRMPLATFYRRYSENKRKRFEEPFV